MIDISSFTELRHQAAGHLGPLHNEDGSLFTKLTTQTEIDFYNLQQIQDEPDLDSDLGSNFKDWMPQYLGVLQSGITQELVLTGKADPEWEKLLVESDDKKYILLENLLYGFNKPSIMDIKLGDKLYDETLDDAKKQRMIQVSKTTTSGSLKFRICGLKIIPKDVTSWDGNEVSTRDEEYVMINKQYGRQLDETNIKQGFETFFQDNKLTTDVQQHLLQMFHVRLQVFYNCLLDSKVELIGSSLFWVFENDLSKWEDEQLHDEIVYPYTVSEDDEGDDEEIPVSKLSSMNVIDFAHSRGSSTPDERVITAVENLISIIETMII